MTLTATGYKVKGVQTVDLEWSGVSGTVVDITRGDLIFAPLADDTPNDGVYTDNIGTKGGGTYGYQVCDANNIFICSPTAWVFF